MADEKKIIIDEDWKAQVEAEKRQSQKSAPAPSAEAPPDSGDVEMPPASFELLLTTLATEVLMALGQVPHPAAQKLQAHPPQAKYLIDTIEVLRDKTKGNLTPQEQQMIDGLLHQLRMAFIQTQSP